VRNRARWACAGPRAAESRADPALPGRVTTQARLFCLPARSRTHTASAQRGSSVSVGPAERAALRQQARSTSGGRARLEVPYSGAASAHLRADEAQRLRVRGCQAGFRGGKSVGGETLRRFCIATPGFADRGPSYELLVFASATGELIGIQHLLRPDIYLHGRPKCPQQPGGEYGYIPRNDTWSCFRAK
jgi:hypothetical protein